MNVFRRIEQLAWREESSELFQRPSINLGRIMGGDAINKVPDRCASISTSATCPARTPAKILQEITRAPDVEVRKFFHREPIIVEATNEYVQLLASAIKEGRPPSGSRSAATAPPTHQLPGRRRARGRVRADRRRTPRSGGVGISLFPGALPQGARRLRGPGGRGTETSTCALLEDFERPGNYWKRLLLGALADRGRGRRPRRSWRWNEVDRLEAVFSQGKELKLQKFLESAEAGQPQTIMLIGSDKRAKTATAAAGGPRSDTIILVRLDPSKKATALLSLPRDLKVRIPGYGTDKINAAYRRAGPS